MKRNCLESHAGAIGRALAAAILAGALFTGVPARADISVRIDIGNAPPAPHFVFRARPHEVFMPGQSVYLVDDPGIGSYDCFRYGGYYWVFSEGYWYRSPSWRGPFLVYDPRYVPTVFYQVPPRRWKHHPSGPPVFTNRSGGGRQQPMSRSGSRSPQVIRQGGGGSPQVVRQVVSAHPARQASGGNGSMGPAKKSGGGSPGAAKKSGNGPSGHAKKDAKGSDKGGGHGGK